MLVFIGDDPKDVSTLLDYDRPQFLAERVRHGGSTITVHPRGEVETSRACEILKRSSPAELVAHGMEDQTFERAAADRNSTVVERILGTDQ